jgi:hypothetical protein|tara:strand:- start:200 stop:400 length:201 start_codon:yes stop_codon:yes gene_type:complete
MTDNQKAKFDELYNSMDYLMPILRQNCGNQIQACDAYHGIILAMAKKSNKKLTMDGNSKMFYLKKQ